MFALATVISGWLVFFLTGSIGQDKLFFMGIILGSISSLLLIVEVHKRILPKLFKEKEILETIYFRDLQDKIGGLIYFITASVLSVILLFIYPVQKADELKKYIFCGCGVLFIVLEYLLYRSNKKLLSERIARVKPFFNIMQDPETRIWQLRRRAYAVSHLAVPTARTDLIKNIVEALASRNWSYFEAVEKNWKDEVQYVLKEIKQEAENLANFWERPILFDFPPTERPLKKVGDQINKFSRDFSTCLASIWAAGYNASSLLAQKEFDLLREFVQRLKNVKQPYFQRLENIAKEICAQAEPDEFKGYLIEVTCLEFLGIKVKMSIRVREVHSMWAEQVKYYSFLSKYPDIKEFFHNLKMAGHKLAEIGQRIEAEWEEFEWREIPHSFL